MNNEKLPPPPLPPASLPTNADLENARKAALQKRKQLAASHFDDGYKGPLRSTVSQEDLEIGTAIAKGAYGAVHRAKLNGEEDVAVKVLEAKKASLSDFKVFFNELILLSSLSHPNVIPFRGGLFERHHSGKYCLILELADRGDLFSYLVHNGTTMSWQQVIGVALQIANGMDHIHSQGILYKDLKSSNVLLKCKPNNSSSDNNSNSNNNNSNNNTEEQLQVLLCDFGTAERVGGSKGEIDEFGSFAELSHGSSQKSEVVGTPLWMAPEVYMKEGQYSFAADVYSFGIILSELITGNEPYWERMYDEWDAILKDVVTKGARPSLLEFPSTDWVAESLCSLATACWHSTAALRPSFTDVIEQLQSILNRATAEEGFPQRSVKPRVQIAPPEPQTPSISKPVQTLKEIQETEHATFGSLEEQKRHRREQTQYVTRITHLGSLITVFDMESGLWSDLPQQMELLLVQQAQRENQQQLPSINVEEFEAACSATTLSRLFEVFRNCDHVRFLLQQQPNLSEEAQQHVQAALRTIFAAQATQMLAAVTSNYLNNKKGGISRVTEMYNGEERVTMHALAHTSNEIVSTLFEQKGRKDWLQHATRGILREISLASSDAIEQTDVKRLYERLTEFAREYCSVLLGHRL